MIPARYSLSAVHMLKKQYCLKYRQEKQRNCRVNALPALRSARLDRVALLFSLISRKRTLFPARFKTSPSRTTVPVACTFFAVDPNSALGEDVENAPYSLGASDEYCACTRLTDAYGRHISADFERPMRFSQWFMSATPSSLWIYPTYFGLRFVAEHAAHAPYQHDYCKQRQYI